MNLTVSTIITLYKEVIEGNFFSKFNVVCEIYTYFKPQTPYLTVILYIKLSFCSFIPWTGSLVSMHGKLFIWRDISTKFSKDYCLRQPYDFRENCLNRTIAVACSFSPCKKTFLFDKMSSRNWHGLVPMTTVQIPNKFFRSDNYSI